MLPLPLCPAAAFDVSGLPTWGSLLFTLCFVGGNVALALVVSDLGSVLHMVGGGWWEGVTGGAAAVLSAPGRRASVWLGMLPAVPAPSTAFTLPLPLPLPLPWPPSRCRCCRWAALLPPT
jgi:hypothetical protein